MLVWLAAAAPVVAERVANYSSVTARESLENLRRRQQQQRRCTAATGTGAAGLELMSDDIDATYDTIDYDVINSVTLPHCFFFFLFLLRVHLSDVFAKSCEF